MSSVHPLPPDQSDQSDVDVEDTEVIEVPPTPEVLEKPPPAITRPRVIVVEHVYHQVPGEPVVGPPATRFYKWLESDEQAVLRTIKVGPEWRSLDLAWFMDGKCSLICIANTTKRLPSKAPTPEEKAEFEARIVEVGKLVEGGSFIEGLCYLPPEEDMRMSNPQGVQRLLVRCLSGQAKVSYFIVPG